MIGEFLGAAVTLLVVAAATCGGVIVFVGLVVVGGRLLGLPEPPQDDE